jgi:hypothetical protein
MSYPSSDLWDGTEVLCGDLYPNLVGSHRWRLCYNLVTLVLNGSLGRRNDVNHSLLKREEWSV